MRVHNEFALLFCKRIVWVVPLFGTMGRVVRLRERLLIYFGKVVSNAPLTMTGSEPAPGQEYVV